MEIRYLLLNHLDKPVRFLYFTIDEAISLLGGFLLGGLAGKPLMGFISGVVISMFLSKMKKAHILGMKKMLIKQNGMANDEIGPIPNMHIQIACIDTFIQRSQCNVRSTLYS